MSTKALACRLPAKSSPCTLWHCPQTFPTQATPGGAAPWFPWQSLHVGAERSPFTIAAACTLPRYFASWSVGILYSAMYVASAWQRAHVSATRSGCTVERGSAGGRMACEVWQLTHVATFG